MKSIDPVIKNAVLLTLTIFDYPDDIIRFIHSIGFLCEDPYHLECFIRILIWKEDLSKALEMIDRYSPHLIANFPAEHEDIFGFLVSELIKAGKVG